MKTVFALSDEYLDYLHSLNYSKKTIRGTRRLLIRFNRYLACSCQVESVEYLGSDVLRKWHAHLSGLRTKEGYPLKATGINRHIVAVRGFLEYLADMGYVRKQLIKVVPYLKEPKTLPKNVVPHTQMRRLLSTIGTDTPENYRNRAMLELLYSSGIRSGELLGLSLADIDIENRTALVHGKGDKDRVVPIGKTAMRYLETWIKAVRPYFVRDPQEKALFLTKAGKRLPYSSFHREVASVVKQSGMDVKVTPHTFRRSCATELIRGGANLYHVKELLGHESLNTLRPYVKLTIVDLKKTHENCHPREKEGS
ncbi:MAG: tyrosine-type recombinase/integrase [Desulfobacteraceae bacterium]|nr:tyrosine-type recombinase/integrase [Desulfobacteraceae bacterium]MBC2758161.1 tyrosine-type recombinase/integrase [Desulfobacteraceae bacterium]